MKVSLAVALGLVASAAAAKVDLKVDTKHELAGTFKAQDGTVMHFRSTPGQLQLAGLLPKEEKPGPPLWILIAIGAMNGTGNFFNVRPPPRAAATAALG